MISSRCKGRDSLLFVYGSLRPFFAGEMAEWLRGVAQHLGPATTPGRLYDLGAYPAMRAARRRGELVAGELYRVANRRVLRVLDRFEAGTRGKAKFVRERCVVDRGRGTPKSAWVYRYRGRVVTAARIPSGDYRVHRRAASV